ncbi:hypothetical protein PR048_032935 [Dryococelus australis]|uniref:Uncharacterized protein n=1 Tax=Dryococelus australis TaxID=614101 RepID=A0ABQ9G6T2_9NEOP|nr:hypothetical protein PR048_032935 [Dryococelus australis]
MAATYADAAGYSYKAYVHEDSRAFTSCIKGKPRIDPEVRLRQTAKNISVRIPISEQLLYYVENICSCEMLLAAVRHLFQAACWCSTQEDFIVFAEFSELTGPIPLVTIPSYIENNVNVNSLIMNIMSLDYQGNTG